MGGRGKNVERSTFNVQRGKAASYHASVQGTQPEVTDLCDEDGSLFIPDFWILRFGFFVKH